MPLYTYQCQKCGHVFEDLVLGSEQPECPKCNAAQLDRLPSMPAAPLKSKSIVQSARAQAFREGHMSNYSSSSQQRLRQGKSEK